MIPKGLAGICWAFKPSRSPSALVVCKISLYIRKTSLCWVRTDQSYNSGGSDLICITCERRTSSDFNSTQRRRSEEAIFPTSGGSGGILHQTPSAKEGPPRTQATIFTGDFVYHLDDYFELCEYYFCDFSFVHAFSNSKVSSITLGKEWQILEASTPRKEWSSKWRRSWYLCLWR